MDLGLFTLFVYIFDCSSCLSIFCLYYIPYSYLYAACTYEIEQQQQQQHISCCRSMRTAGVKESEICEEDEVSCAYERIDAEARKHRIRKIISHQKSLYLSSHLLLSSSSSSTSDSSSASSCSSSSSSTSSSLLELMKGGGTRLGRLFDMEHTSLAAHMKEYSGSPTTRSIFLWGSDSCEDEQLAYWSPVKSFRRSPGEELGGLNSNMHEHDESAAEGEGEDGIVANEVTKKKKKKKMRRLNKRRLLMRNKSYRNLPSVFNLSKWKWKGFRLLLRLRRLKIFICGKFLY